MFVGVAGVARVGDVPIGVAATVPEGFVLAAAIAVAVRGGVTARNARVVPVAVGLTVANTPVLSRLTTASSTRQAASSSTPAPASRRRNSKIRGWRRLFKVPALRQVLLAQGGYGDPTSSYGSSATCFGQTTHPIFNSPPPRLHVPPNLFIILSVIIRRDLAGYQEH